MENLKINTKIKIIIKMITNFKLGLKQIYIYIYLQLMN